MYCPECQVDRPRSHAYCFRCGALLKGDHQNEQFTAMVDTAAQESNRAFFEMIKDFANQHPENPFAQKMFGNALFHKGKLIEAELRYRSAIDLDPDNVEDIYDLAIVLYYQGRMAEALEQLKKVILLDPEYSPAHYRLGLIHYHLGHYEDAVRHYKQCTVLAPDFAMAHYHLGVVYAKMGEVDEAIKEFNHELEKNLTDAACRHHLEELFIKKWKKEEGSTPS